MSKYHIVGNLIDNKFLLNYAVDNTLFRASFILVNHAYILSAVKIALAPQL